MWIMIPILLSYVDENITLSLEAVLQKILLCAWHRNWWLFGI